MVTLFDIGWGPAVTFIVIALLSWELGWIVYCRTLHPLSKVPGPFLASISRLWLWRVVWSGNMHYVQADLHEKYGMLIRVAPNEVACSDPAAIKEVYRIKNPLEKSDFYAVWQNKSFGKHKDNFSVINEREHADRRRIVNHVYSLSNVLKSEAYIDQCSIMFIQKLGAFADRADSIDFGQWLQMYAFDVIGELYFGQMFGFMESESDYQSLIHSLDVLNPLLAGMAVSASYARTPIILSAVTSSAIRGALKGIEHVSTKAKACVKERMGQIQNNSEGTVPRQDLLQQLISIMEEKGHKLDFGIPEVEYEAYVGLFAGSDTTAIAMRSIFYHLARSPKVAELLVKEIDEAFSLSEHPPDRPIAYADAIKLPYLCATIKEGMRLHPSVAFTMPRVSPSEGIVVDGTFVPPGYRIGLNAYVIQRQQEIYGEDANVSRPERWLEGDSSLEQIREMDRCMLHFGAGTRTCIGKNISLSEMHKLIPHVLRNFELKLVHATHPLIHHNHWFNKQTGLHLQLKKRY